MANEKYNSLIDSTKLLQKHSPLDDETKNNNHLAYQSLFDQLISARKAYVGMRERLTEIPDMEKSQIKAKRRMQNAMNSLIQAMDGWITRTSELLSL